jgi:hypothetical protein
MIFFIFLSAKGVIVHILADSGIFLDPASYVEGLSVLQTSYETVLFGRESQFSSFGIGSFGAAGVNVGSLGIFVGGSPVVATRQEIITATAVARGSIQVTNQDISLAAVRMNLDSL